MDDTLETPQGKRYSWVTNTGTDFDYRLIAEVRATASEKATTKSYFCQIRYNNPNKANLYSFGLVSEFIPRTTGKKYYFTEAFVDICIQENNITTTVHPFGIKENSEKIKELKKYLNKLLPYSIIYAQDVRIRDLEEFTRFIKLKPKFHILNLLGF